MSKRSRSKADGAKIDPNAWMATLSDLVFLLITFFVLLISMSSLDAKKLRDAFGFFDDAVDVLKYPEGIAGSNTFMKILNPLASFTKKDLKYEITVDTDKRYEAARKLIQGIAESLNDDAPLDGVMEKLKPLATKSSGTVKFEVLKDGYAVTLPDRLLFDRDTKEIGEEGREVLSNIASICKLWGGDVRVIGIWPWHEGPQVLAVIVEQLEKFWVDGKSLYPVLRPGNDKTVRFVLREG